jgi:uncharacterized protein (TIGR02453 family)
MPAKGLALLSQLERNNSTEWFHEHKDEYRALVHEPMLHIVECVNDALSEFAPAYVTTKKKSGSGPPYARSPLSRPNRDTRFSKDKAPYRTDISAVFPCRGLEKHQAAGFFLRVSATGAELVAGSFMPGPDELRAIRQHLDTQHETFRAVATAKPLTKVFGALRGERLTRVPRPFDAAHSAADLLRMTQFYFQRAIPKAVVVSPRFVSDVVASFRTATPFVEALDVMLGNVAVSAR